MQTWQPAGEDLLSFSSLFSRLRPPSPEDTTISTATKALGFAEIETSGRSLHRIQHLRLDALKISDDHTLPWAANVLGDFGPHPLASFPHFWDPEILRTTGPQYIGSEPDSATYFTYCLLRPALTAAIFLRAQHLDLTPPDGGVFPGPRWDVIDSSSVGSSGRADRIVVRRISGSSRVQGIALTCESKTYRVCRSNGLNLDGAFEQTIPVFEYVGRWLQDNGGVIPMDPPNPTPVERPVGDLIWYQRPWQKKIQKFMFQTWHQLLSRNTQHGIILNEKEFILVVREGNALFLSDVYQCAPPTTAQTCTTMTHLAYFLAHAISTRFPSDLTYLPFPPPTSHDTHPAPSVGHTPPDSSDGQRSHRKTDSQATITDALLKITRGVERALSILFCATPSPSQLIFTTSGSPSPPMKLIAVDCNLRPASVPHRATTGTVVLSQFLHQSQRSLVFRGHFNKKLIVAKMVPGLVDRTQSWLQTEYAVYQRLHRQQGSLVPRCYGLFRVDTFGLVLLVEDCGRSLLTFDELSVGQRNILASHLAEIHQHNISHGDLEPRNILISESGRLSIVDFEFSDMFHQCQKDQCAELQFVFSFASRFPDNAISEAKSLSILLISMFVLLVGIMYMFATH